MQKYCVKRKSERLSLYALIIQEKRVVLYGLRGVDNNKIHPLRWKVGRFERPYLKDIESKGMRNKVPFFETALG
ncbi:CLUMA_CG000988, isoform A [Clunio marinus]|uniref:CLUMA_CG000988, isoform A n=1 Tax=Clunio marinus TaxID=568069 RepID=A0A1J1HIF1_9DIPT|nr:CLUMA_CG000988, isoform A [Clunio marinus]